MQANTEERVKAVLDVFKDKLIKRGVSLKALDAGEPRASGKEYSSTPTLKEGITQENAKKIGKIIRDEGPKSVKAQIQGDELRVSSKTRDDLQAVIALRQGHRPRRRAAVHQLPLSRRLRIAVLRDGSVTAVRHRLEPGDPLGHRRVGREQAGRPADVERVRDHQRAGRSAAAARAAAARAAMPSSSLRSALARASGSRGELAPDSSAWYSRDRLIASWMIAGGDRAEDGHQQDADRVAVLVVARPPPKK